jgi:hypothetical protein
VLDDVERRALPPHPAREDTLELAVAVSHVELDERAGQALLLPGRGRLARAQAHDHVLDPHRLAGPERQLASDAVALVEQADHRDPLGHRSGAGRELAHRLRDVDDLRLGLSALILRVALRRPGRAAG